MQKRLQMKNKLLLSFAAWEVVVLGCVVLVMAAQGRSFNSENLHKIGFVFSLGILVVLVAWPVCRLLSRSAGAAFGFVIGLVVPPLAAWIWALSLPFPWWTGSFDIKILAVVLAIPSAVGGAASGLIQSRTNAKVLSP
jgi:hypothetical protein